MLSRPYGRTVVSLFRPPLPPDDDADPDDGAAPEAADASA
jgi:16S rRNA (guanine966-N2)-methyltransferase